MRARPASPLGEIAFSRNQSGKLGKRLQFARRFLRQEVEIVVERTMPIEGWTGEYLRCKTAGSAPRKSRVRIVVTHVHGDATLEGRLVGVREGGENVV